MWTTLLYRNLNLVQYSKYMIHDHQPYMNALHWRHNNHD